jgi:hypothetical protein
MSGDGVTVVRLREEEVAFLRELLKKYKAPDPEHEGVADELWVKLS